MSEQATIMPNLRRVLYMALMVPALVIVLIGTLGRQSDQILAAIAAPYFVWFLLFATFIWLHLLETAVDSEFFITCIYHLLCIGAVMTFLHSLQGGDSHTFVLWIPIAIQVGIFLAIGFQECASVSWRHICGLPPAAWNILQHYILSFTGGLRWLLIWSLGSLLRLLGGNEDERLPTFDPASTSSAVTVYSST